MARPNSIIFEYENWKHLKEKEFGYTTLPKTNTASLKCPFSQGGAYWLEIISIPFQRDIYKRHPKERVWFTRLNAAYPKLKNLNFTSPLYFTLDSKHYFKISNQKFILHGMMGFLYLDIKNKLLSYS